MKKNYIKKGDARKVRGVIRSLIAEHGRKYRDKTAVAVINSSRITTKPVTFWNVFTQRSKLGIRLHGRRWYKRKAKPTTNRLTDILMPQANGNGKHVDQDVLKTAILHLNVAMKSLKALLDA